MKYNAQHDIAFSAYDQRGSERTRTVLFTARCLRETKSYRNMEFALKTIFTRSLYFTYQNNTMHMLMA